MLPSHDFIILGRLSQFQMWSFRFAMKHGAYAKLNSMIYIESSICLTLMNQLVHDHSENKNPLYLETVQWFDRTPPWIELRYIWMLRMKMITNLYQTTALTSQATDAPFPSACLWVIWRPHNTVVKWNLQDVAYHRSCAVKGLVLGTVVLRIGSEFWIPARTCMQSSVIQWKKLMVQSWGWIKQMRALGSSNDEVHVAGRGMLLEH